VLIVDLPIAAAGLVLDARCLPARCVHPQPPVQVFAVMTLVALTWLLVVCSAP
jgi:hypothetical protein